ncbi:DUF4112 domain-containing protein [Phormidium sp. LEGE 05292]|uniref:DUF4112 domain-containing protein n=1 Tax=[Phormidium] sp. LEGE 05292 TaxID=767427 RepID=UPI00187E1C21|nr:DUF4112 domain-containing protein [Phormidium sp. LEGE 05292]MBE9229777.1 DUF4112 domain-containing protein [Phormidium sp. LEGE 05292]
MITKSQRTASTLKRLRRISHVLDNAIAIPGTKFRFGIDPILGLIPGGGDTVSAFFAAYIIWESAMLGLPKEVLIRMFSNILFDTFAGSVPIAGDIFDVAWKANVRNVALLEEYLQLPESNEKPDKWFLVLLLIGLIMFVAVVGTISILIISFLFNLITGNK